MNYTKSLDLADNCQSPSVFITSRCDYVNCRVISPRRLDIRGAVTSRIKVVCEKTQSIVTDASGGSIQLKKQLLTYPAKRLTADKRVTVIEELELAGHGIRLGRGIALSLLRMDMEDAGAARRAEDNRRQACYKGRCKPDDALYLR